MNKLLCKVASIDAATNTSLKKSYKRESSWIYVRDLKLDMFIGICDFEKEQKQPVIINIKAKTSLEDQAWRRDDISQVADYAPLVLCVRDLATKGHIGLLETFVDMIAENVMQVSHITEAWIKVEKPTIFEDANGAGVELHVTRAST